MSYHMKGATNESCKPNDNSRVFPGIQKPQDPTAFGAQILLEKNRHILLETENLREKTMKNVELCEKREPVMPIEKKNFRCALEKYTNRLSNREGTGIKIPLRIFGVSPDTIASDKTFPRKCRCRVEHEHNRKYYIANFVVRSVVIAACLAVAMQALFTQSETTCTPTEPITIYTNTAEYIEPVAIKNSSTYYYCIPLDADLQTALIKSCAAHGVPLSLALGVIEIESNFQPDAMSSSGCYGFMQLNPRYFPSGLTPAENMECGLEFFGALLERYGDTHMALVCYNCGEQGAYRNYFSVGVYTSCYSRAVTAAMERWESLLDGEA